MSAESAELFRQADPGEVQDAEFCRKIHWHVPRAGVQPADVLMPVYWQKCELLLRRNDRIECCPADASWFAELLVRSVGAEGVVVVPMRGATLEGETAPPGKVRQQAQASDYEARYEGEIAKWAVVRTRDNHRMKGGLPDETTCQQWIAAHLKTAKGPYPGKVSEGAK